MKTILYSIAFRKRHIKASSLTTLIVAGASLLVGAILGLIPGLSSPGFVFVVTVGTAIYLCRQYTDGKLYPDLIAIVVAVELIAYVIINIVEALITL